MVCNMKNLLYVFYFTLCLSFGKAVETSEKISVNPYLAYAPVPSSLAVAFAPPGGGMPEADDLHCHSNQQYVVPHSVYCDRFYACDNGTPVMYQCEDGYGYHVEKQECKYLHLVKCGTRKKLQTPRGSGICQRLNGLYADRDHGCEKYYNCGNGTSYPTACPGGLVFDDMHKYCREATAEDRQKCVQEPLVLSCGGVKKTGYSQTTCSTFKCPLMTEYPFGDHARYPNPADCKSFIICLRDGTALVKGCPGDMIFSNVQYVCVNATQTNECYDPVHARKEFFELV